ncbi:DUF5058 family protein [Neofamilia massiliensis]|uniref:DUF5058 family protein n=1 Tax=Neofamilia massiliensis TaxID=1673724 RepID=UPI0006BB6B93|nr:DUF5058 family protein [Neofamilia massiliensis]
MSLKEILNSPIFYICVIIGLVVIFAIALFFFLRARKRAIEMGVSKEKINSVIRGSIVFSIIPSISIIIGLISLTPLLGTPWPWFRLSVVGSLPYELVAADLSSESAGYENLADFAASTDVNALGAVLFVMSIAIMGGMIFNIFFLKPLHTGVMKAGTKDTPAVDLALSVLIIGMMSVFVPTYFMQSKISAIVLLISAAITYLLTKLSKKDGMKWLGDYVMSFALVIGMASAVFLTGIM